MKVFHKGITNENRNKIAGIVYIKKKKKRRALSFMEEDKISNFFYEIQMQELDG